MENTTVAFRLSPQQERVWSQQQDGTAHSYRVQCDILLQGEVEAGRLLQGLQTVVDRHEILRTVFRRRAGVKFPFQVILDESRAGWQEFDWRQLGPETQDSRLRDLQQARAHANFDFEHGPLLQAEFVTLSSRRHLLALTAPALCLDSKSLQNLAAEIARSYGGSVSESDEIMQYADFVEWQHELLEAEDTKAGRDYWRDYCRSLDFSSLSALVLPGANAEGSGEFEVASAPVSLGVERADLDSVASKYGAPAQDILCACFLILLARVTSHSDVILGRSFDGRRHEELHDALGAFSKCLPIRFQFQPGVSVGELVTQVARATEQASKWQETFTFQQVEAAAADLRFLPYGFEYEEVGGRVEEGGVGFEVVSGYGCTERFRVKLRCVAGEKGLIAELQYDRKSYEPGAIARLAGQYQTLLQAAVKNPQQAAGELPLLTAAEREQMLVEWNQTASELRPQWVPQWFEQQAERWPERVAVVCGEQQLSYGELNAVANRLAHCLRRQGVGPEMLVGLCLERSVEQMVAVLAIMKAGGAYVPLSADHPKARLQQQMAGLKVLLTESTALAQLPAFEGAVLCMDRDRERWAGESEQNPAAEITAENLAYVLYTSGSTGAPKGVAISHGNLANYTQFICQRLQLDKFPQGLQFATVSTLAADLGNTCIYPALVSGGSLHLISYEVATDSRQLSAYAERHPIDVLKIVPSHLEALLASAEATAIVPRQYLILGGELLRPRLLEQVRSKGGSCQILNHYGPTETTVGSLTLWLEQEWTARPDAASVPIGRPIANTRVYILDGQRQPVPVGVAGELHIAGAGVARGYVNHADWTAERFLADPFWAAGGRMYRTGDLARYLANGQVEFLGRNDDQVKVRGFRIELGEIEAALREHGSVRQAAVLARDDGRGGEKRLVAYVVAERAQPVSSEQLRQHLRERLPEHMLPAAIALLDKLPLTANGKLDRQGLPDPEQTTQREYVAPRTATEEVIAAIWAEVLERDPISRDDNFFDLGGHSLLATQVISRLRERMQVEVALRSLFETPTVAGLAESLDGKTGSAEAEAAIPAVSRDRYRVSGTGEP
jgi:amino acid adenylation domain-containing protein